MTYFPLLVLWLDKMEFQLVNNPAELESFNVLRLNANASDLELAQRCYEFGKSLNY